MDDINENNIESAQPVVQEVPVLEEDKSDKLSPREALALAIEEKRTRQPDQEESKSREIPTQKEVKAAVTADIEPPAEFSAEGKKAWREKDLGKVQEEYQRLSRSRLQELSRAQNAERQAKEEAKTWRELGNMAAPYIESRGQQGVTPQQAIMEALTLIQEFKKANPQTVKAELKRIGIDLDSTSTAATSTVDESKINALQETVLELKREREAEHFQRTVKTFESVFDSLASQKTRTGDPVFPGLLDNSEAGREFAKEIGSLTSDERFQAGVLRRFPDADLQVLVREAYKYLGGKVSGEPVTVSASNQKHIEKSRRAAASSPQGATIKSRNDGSNLVGKLSPRAALQKALEEQREH